MKESKKELEGLTPKLLSGYLKEKMLESDI